MKTYLLIATNMMLVLALFACWTVYGSAHQ